MHHELMLNNPKCSELSGGRAQGFGNDTCRVPNIVSVVSTLCFLYHLFKINASGTGAGIHSFITLSAMPLQKPIKWKLQRQAKPASTLLNLAKVPVSNFH